MCRREKGSQDAKKLKMQSRRTFLDRMSGWGVDFSILSILLILSKSRFLLGLTCAADHKPASIVR